MSIASEISRLQTAKADIKTAIEAKGVTVPANATLDTYDTYVSQISGGGGTSKLPQIIDRSVISLTASDLTGITKIGNSAFRSCPSLTSIEIPTSVTTIDNNAFYDCKALTSITIPNSVTSIGINAFNSCNAATSITIGNSVTTIGDSAFRYCWNLTSVILPASVTNLGSNAFLGCTRLVTADLSQTGISKILSGCFSGNDALTNVTLPSTITELGSTCFGSCAALSAITFLGTMAQWNAITKSSSWKNNTPITTIHCSDGDITL